MRRWLGFVFLLVVIALPTFAADGLDLKGQEEEPPIGFWHRDNLQNQLHFAPGGICIWPGGKLAKWRKEGDYAVVTLDDKPDQEIWATWKVIGAGHAIALYNIFTKTPAGNQKSSERYLFFQLLDEKQIKAVPIPDPPYIGSWEEEVPTLLGGKPARKSYAAVFDKKQNSCAFGKDKIWLGYWRVNELIEPGILRAVFANDGQSKKTLDFTWSVSQDGQVLTLNYKGPEDIDEVIVLHRR